MSAAGRRVSTKVAQLPINASGSLRSPVKGSSRLRANVLLSTSCNIAERTSWVWNTCLPQRMLKPGVPHAMFSGWWHGSLTTRPRSWPIIAAPSKLSPFYTALLLVDQVFLMARRTSPPMRMTSMTSQDRAGQDNDDGVQMGSREDKAR